MLGVIEYLEEKQKNQRADLQGQKGKFAYSVKK